MVVLSPVTALYSPQSFLRSQKSATSSKTEEETRAARPSLNQWRKKFCFSAISGKPKACSSSPALKDWGRKANTECQSGFSVGRCTVGHEPRFQTEHQDQQTSSIEVVCSALHYPDRISILDWCLYSLPREKIMHSKFSGCVIVGLCKC